MLQRVQADLGASAPRHGGDVGKSQGQTVPQDCKTKASHWLPGATSPLGLNSDPWRAYAWGSSPPQVAIYLSLYPDILLASCSGRPSYCGHWTVQLKASGDCARRLKGHRPTLVFSVVSLHCVLPLHPATHPTRPGQPFSSPRVLSMQRNFSHPSLVSPRGP